MEFLRAKLCKIESEKDLFGKICSICSICWIVEILKNKLKRCFYKQQSYFSQIVSKKAKITTRFF